MADYREVVFQGSKAEVCAFLTGYKLGKGWATDFYIICSDCHIKAESRGYRILEALRLEKDLTHALILDARTESIVNAIKGSKKLNLKVMSNKPVKKAHFDYNYATANRRSAGNIKRLFKQMPAELKLVNARDKEVLHPKSKGAEGYAPEHDFELSGRGGVEGPIDQLLSFRASIGKIETVHVTDITINPGR